MKKIFIIIISFLILIAIVFGIKFLLQNNTNNLFQKEPVKILTEKEKMDILNQVSTTTPLKNTLSDKQKESILNKVSTTTPVTEMTYEEKMKILNATQ